MEAEAYYNRYTGTRAILLKVTMENFDIAAEFVKGEVVVPGKKMRLKTPKGDRMARVGESVVKNNIGQVYRAGKQFHQTYLPVEPKG